MPPATHEAPEPGSGSTRTTTRATWSRAATQAAVVPMTPAPTTTSGRLLAHGFAPCAGMTRIRFDGRGWARRRPLSPAAPGSRVGHRPAYALASGAMTASTAARTPTAALAADDRLARARLYLCTDARRDTGDLAEFVDAALRGGVDMRAAAREGDWRRSDELAALEILADACRRHGALFAVNDRADIALAAGADVLHLGQDDLPGRRSPAGSSATTC